MKQSFESELVLHIEKPHRTAASCIKPGRLDLSQAEGLLREVYKDHPTALETSLTLVISASWSAFTRNSLSFSTLPCIFAALAK